MAMIAPPSRKGVVGQMETSMDFRGLLSRQHISTTSAIPKPNTAQVAIISLGIGNDMKSCLSRVSKRLLETAILGACAGLAVVDTRHSRNYVPANYCAGRAGFNTARAALIMRDRSDENP